MKKNNALSILIVLLLFGCFIHCKPAVNNDEQLAAKEHINDSTGYLLSFNDTLTDGYGYKNQKGEVIIPAGKYARCFTDTFKTYAIVAKPNSGFIAIDRQENILYEVFIFDNGPDEISEGLFRIVKNKKIGYADFETGKIVIQPQFDCAFPFKNAAAKVSIDCKTESAGEHSAWISDHWYYIDKKGKKIEAPKTEE